MILLSFARTLRLCGSRASAINENASSPTTTHGTFVTYAVCGTLKVCFKIFLRNQCVQLHLYQNDDHFFSKLSQFVIGVTDSVTQGCESIYNCSIMILLHMVVGIAK